VNLKITSGRMVVRILVDDRNHKVKEITPKILYRFIGHNYLHLTQWLETKHSFLKTAYLLSTEKKQNDFTKNCGESRKPKERY
jgi:hypothetical protein